MPPTTPSNLHLHPLCRQVYAAFRETADWTRLLAPGQSFSVDSRVWSCSNLSSSQVRRGGGRAGTSTCIWGTAAFMGSRWGFV